MSDYSYAPEDYVGRHEIIDAGGRVFLLDTITGDAWVLCAERSAAPRWTRPPWRKIGSDTDNEKRD